MSDRNQRNHFRYEFRTTSLHEANAFLDLVFMDRTMGAHHRVLFNGQVMPLWQLMRHVKLGTI